MFVRHGSRCISSSLQNQKYKVKTRHPSQYRLSCGSFLSRGTRLLPQRPPLDSYQIEPLLGAAESPSALSRQLQYQLKVELASSRCLQRNRIRPGQPELTRTNGVLPRRDIVFTKPPADPIREG